MAPPKGFPYFNRGKTNFLLVLTLFSIILILSSTYSVDAFTWNRPTLIEATLNVNSSSNWDTNIGSLDGVNDTQHDNIDSELTIKESWLTTFGNNIWCELTGCTMEGDIDMDGNDLDNVGDIEGDGTESYFNQTLLISGDSPVSKDSDASLWLKAEVNYDACINLTESTIQGITLCYDGSGSGIFEVRNFRDGTLYMTIDNRDSGNITFFNDTNFYTINVETINITGDFTGIGANLSFLYGVNGIGGIDMRGDPWWFSGADFQMTENLTVDGNASATWFNGKFNWITGDDWNIFDGSTLTFNSSKLSTQFFNASTIEVVTGTPQGSIEDLRSFNNVGYNVSEVSSDFELRINFTGITDFNNLIIRYRAELDFEAHDTHIDIWDYVLEEWEHKGDLPSEAEWNTPEFGIFDSAVHIGAGDDEGIVQVRVIQDGGNPPRTHKHEFDWITISLGFGTPAQEEVDPHLDEWLMNPIFNFNVNGSTVNSTWAGVNTTWLYGNPNINIGSSVKFGLNSFNGSGDFTTTGVIETKRLVSTDVLNVGSGTMFSNLGNAIDFLDDLVPSPVPFTTRTAPYNYYIVWTSGDLDGVSYNIQVASSEGSWSGEEYDSFTLEDYGGEADSGDTFNVYFRLMILIGDIDAISLRSSSDIFMANDLIHVDDPNTYIGFRGDRMDIVVGGIAMTRFSEAGADFITFNPDGEELWLAMEGDANPFLFLLNPIEDRIGISEVNPEELFDVGGNQKIAGNLRLGTASISSNTTFPVGNINASGWIYARGFSSYSPIPFCSNNWCAVFMPEIQETYYIKINENLDILEAKDNDKNIISVNSLPSEIKDKYANDKQYKINYNNWQTEKISCEDNVNSYPSFTEYNSGNQDCYFDEVKAIHDCKSDGWHYLDGEVCKENLYLKCYYNATKDWDFETQTCEINPIKECETKEDMVWDYKTKKCIFSQDKQDRRLIIECLEDKSKYWDGDSCENATNLN